MPIRIACLTTLLLHLGTSPIRAQSANPRDSAGGLPFGRYGQIVTAAQAHFPLIAGRWEFRFGPEGLAGVFNPLGERMVLGTYVIRGDTLIVTDVDGPMSCARDPNLATAVLLWKLEGDRLTLRTLDDPCVGRRGSGLHEFTRITEESPAKAPPDRREDVSLDGRRSPHLSALWRRAPAL